MYQVEYARNLSLPEIRAEYSACITDAGSILYRLVTGREGNMATNHAVGIKSNRFSGFTWTLATKMVCVCAAK